MQRSTRCLLVVLAILACTLFAVVPVIANTWSLAADFSSTVNGNRGWWYGQEDYYTATDPTHWSVDWSANSASMYAGEVFATQFNPSVPMWGWGQVVYTTVPTTVSRYYGGTTTGTIAGGVVLLGYYRGDGINPQDKHKVRWVAPAEGDYVFNVTFSRPANALNGVYVNKGDKSASPHTLTKLVTEQYITDTTSAVSFTQGVHLSSGQFLEFVVDTVGSDGVVHAWEGNRICFVQVDATITEGQAGTTGAISGVIKDTSGNVLAGATVQDMNTGGASATTALDGTYTILAVPYGAHTIQASKPGYSTEQASITLGSPTATCDITNLAPSYIRGTVTDSVNSVPVAGATVSITGGYASATTASDGTYTFQVSPGSYDLTAHKTNFADASLAGVTVARAANVTGQNIAMTPLTGAVSGIVTDSLGAPINGVAIQDLAAGGPSTTTLPNGSYLLNGVVAGTHAIQASLRGYATEQLVGVSVSAGLTTSGQNLSLTASHISGTVTDATTHAAISGAKVTAVPGGASATTSSSGSYTLLVSPGTYVVTATETSHIPGSLTGIVVAKGDSLTGKDLSLTAGWDFASAFVGPNPSGPWSYWYIAGDQTEHGMSLHNLRYPGESWTGDTPSGWPYYWGPMFLKNTSGSPTTTSITEGMWHDSGIYQEADKVVARAGFADNLAAVARFTVASGGVYTVTAKFAGMDTDGTTVVPVAIRHNGDYVFGQFKGTSANGYTDSYGDQQLVSGFAGTSGNGYADSNGLNPVVTFSQTIPCAATDTIDAVVLYPGSSAWSKLVQVDMTVAAATSGIGTVSGVVKSDLPGNPPIAGATVSLQGGGAPLNVTTGSNGSYSVSVPSGNTYDIQVSANGCEDGTITGLSVSEGQTYTKNFTLHHTGVWNLYNDFSAVFNPNGQWSFLGGGNLYQRGHFAWFAGGRTVWGAGSVSDLDFQQGWIDRVVNDGPFAWSVYSVLRGYVDNGQVVLGGGQAQTVVRWTSPYDVQKIMSIDLTMSDLAPTGQALSLQVKKNGSILNTKTVQGFVGSVANQSTDSVGPAPRAAYLTDLMVNPGDTIDFGTAYLHDGLSNYFVGFPSNEGMGIALIIKPGSGTICGSVKDLKSKPVDGKTCFLTTPVAAICDLNADHGFADSTFYVEDVDRSAGIKCLGNPALVQVNVSQGGKLVTLSGKLVLDPNGCGQKVLNVDTITSVGDGTRPVAVGTVGKAFTAAPKPINMLARAWGKVVEKVANPDSATNTNWPWLYWTINDGSQNVRIGMIGQQGQLNTPNLVSVAANDYISVTGISTLDGSGNVVIMPWTEGCVIDYTVAP